MQILDRTRTPRMGAGSRCLSYLLPGELERQAVLFGTEIYPVELHTCTVNFTTMLKIQVKYI